MLLVDRLWCGQNTIWSFAYSYGPGLGMAWPSGSVKVLLVSHCLQGEE